MGFLGSSRAPPCEAQLVQWHQQNHTPRQNLGFIKQHVFIGRGCVLILSWATVDSRMPFVLYQKLGGPSDFTKYERANLCFRVCLDTYEGCQHFRLEAHEAKQNSHQFADSRAINLVTEVLLTKLHPKMFGFEICFV